MGVDVRDLLKQNLEKRGVNPDDILKTYDEHSAVLRDLATKKFATPAALFSYFESTYPGLFTQTQATNIWTKMNAAKRGGGIPSSDLLSPTISDALDNLLGIFIPEVREPIKSALGLGFILSYVEQLPLFGPLVGSALDLTAAVLPTLAVTAQNIMPTLVSLIPLPYMSFVGMGIGWAFSFVLLYLTMLIGLSRKKFGDSVEAVAGMIPILGATAMNVVQKANLTAAKLNDRRQQVVESVSELASALSEATAGLGDQTKQSLRNIVSEAKTAGGLHPRRRRNTRKKWQRRRRTQRKSATR
jgi:hypothetical protein